MTEQWLKQKNAREIGKLRGQGQGWGSLFDWAPELVLSQIIGWSRLFDWKPESVCPSVKFSQIIGFLADYLTNDSKRRVYGFECRVNQNHSKNWFAVQFSPNFRYPAKFSPQSVTDRQTDTQTHTQTDRQINRLRAWGTSKLRHWDPQNDIFRKALRKTDFSQAWASSIVIIITAVLFIN